MVLVATSHASAQEFVASLSGANEVPPSGSSATGEGTFQLNPDGSVTYSVATAGVVGTMAHLHLAPAGANGPVIAPLSGGPALWSGTTAPLSLSQIAALNSAGVYVNVHSNQVPSGEIRGQLHARLSFAGLPHTALGQATVAKDVTGRLVVSNLGSSGLDGVSIDLGETDYHNITFETLGAAALPTGAHLEVTSTGEMNGLPNQDIWALRVEDVGTQYALSIDTKNVMPGSFEVRLLLGGAVVATFPTSLPQPGQPLAVFAPEGCFIDPVWAVNDELLAIVALAGTGPVTVLGQAAVLADQVILVASNGIAQVGALSATRMQGTDMQSITLVKEQLGMFHHGHSAIDGAHITGTQGKLKISNIGSSGCDGVSIDLGHADSADVKLEPVSLSGATITLSSVGSFNGVAKTDLGHALLRDNGATVDAIVDFAALGATKVRVEVWSDNARQGVAVAPNGSVVASVSPNLAIFPSLTGCGKLPPDPPCLIIILDDNYPVDLGGGAVVFGNEVRLLAADAIGSIDSLSSYTIQASNVAEMVITAEAELDAVAYGAGCAGSGGFVPELDLTGNLVAGSTVSLEITKGLGGASAVVFIGLGPTSLPVGHGCSLLVIPVVTSFSLPLFGTGPGNGQFIAPIGLPLTTSGVTFTLQAFCLDPTTILGASSTNGLKVSIE